MSRAVDHFTDEMERLIYRFRLEYDMSYAEAIGALTLILADLVDEARDDED